MDSPRWWLRSNIRGQETQSGSMDQIGWRSREEPCAVIPSTMKIPSLLCDNLVFPFIALHATSRGTTPAGLLICMGGHPLSQPAAPRVRSRARCAQTRGGTNLAHAAHRARQQAAFLPQRESLPRPCPIVYPPPGQLRLGCNSNDFDRESGEHTAGRPGECGRPTPPTHAGAVQGLCCVDVAEIQM